MQIVTIAFSETNVSRWKIYLMSLINISNKNSLSLKWLFWPEGVDTCPLWPVWSSRAQVLMLHLAQQSCRSLFTICVLDSSRESLTFMGSSVLDERKEQNLWRSLFIWKGCSIILMVIPRKEPSFRHSVLLGLPWAVLEVCSETWWKEK